MIDNRYEDAAVTSSLMEYLESPENLDARDNFAEVVFDISKRHSATTAAESLRVTAFEMRLEDEIAKLREELGNTMNRKISDHKKYSPHGTPRIRG